jgi:hypothetical protein
MDIICFKDLSGGWYIRKLANKFDIGITQVAKVLIKKYNQNNHGNYNIKLN